MDPKNVSNRSCTIDLPADILLALHETELKQSIKVSWAIRLYKLEKLTTGKAAQLTGLSRLEFETVLSENKVPISNLTMDDIDKDLEKLHKA